MSSPPAHWRRYKERYRLIGIECESCGKRFFPIRKICPNCRRKGTVKVVQFSGRGKVYSFTTIRIPPSGFEAFSPYVVALVELEEGPRVTSQITDCDPDQVYIGMPVEVCFRRIRSENPDGIICYGFKFKPLRT